MICSKCGTQNNDSGAFCVECGAQLNPFVNMDQNSYAQNQQQQQPYQQQSFPQQGYQQNMVNYPSGYNYSEDEHVSTLMWIGIFAINIIPGIGSLVYLILLFVWAFGSTPKKSLKTFAQAQLIISLVVVVLLVLFFLITGVTISELANEYSYSY